MPQFGAAMESRQAAFQTLKPPCVSLSQASLTLQGGNTGDSAVTHALESVLRALDSVTRKPDSLDVKLADYVFFPLSQVLKASQRLSIRSLELSLQCLQTLIQEGWREHIASPLTSQLLILLTLMSDQKPQGLASKDTTDELRTAAFGCLTALFTAMTRSIEGKRTLTAAANVPALGQAITRVLDGIESGASVDVQLEASGALAVLTGGVDDAEMLASFLPGIMSRLTKILTPKSSRRDFKVLVTCLDILTALLEKTLSDAATSNIAMSGPNVTEAEGRTPKRTKLDAAWVDNASKQIQSALSKIIRLQTHTRHEVKEAVARLCVMLLHDCKTTLSSCCKLALETLITLSSGFETMSSNDNASLVAHSGEPNTGLVQSILYDWMTGLATVMQGSDDDAKVARMKQMKTAYGLLQNVGFDTAVIDRMFASALRDSVGITLNMPSKRSEGAMFASPVQSMDLAVLEHNSGSTTFSNCLVKYKGQEDVLNSLERLADALGHHSSSSAFTADLARSLHTSRGDEQVANFWLLLTAVRSAIQQKDDIDALLNIGSEIPGSADYLEDLYSFSLNILSNTLADDPQDPRMVSLALQALALQAIVSGQEFRYELIDALYPVLHTLATPSETLQNDAMACLNCLASSCNYLSVRDLIVENVDYLTNTVALKINAFDVSPQAPQVLLMMVRLAGPRLLPYLEDTIDAIFVALEDYHGYPLLVELLFRVLAVVAEEGVQARQLAIEDARVKRDVAYGLKERWQPVSVASLAELLREDASRDAEIQMRSGSSPRPEGTSFPHRPWKAVEDILDEDESVESRNNRTQDQTIDGTTEEEQPMEDIERPPPAPKTYAILLKITELTQHYLSSASPSLRTSLLSLIKRTVPAIAKHENSFLPLINTLWPEIVSRLEEPEAHIQATALEIVAVLCEYAGDFMRSRIHELWSLLVDMQKRLVKDTFGSKRSAGEAGPMSGSQKPLVRLTRDLANVQDTATRQLWIALVDCLTTVVQHVPITAEMFDEVLEMLEPLLFENSIVAILQLENADAVWHARLQIGAISPPATPICSEGDFWSFAALPT